MKSRHQTLTVKIGNLLMGENNPILIQSMTDTNTEDANSTVSQIIELIEAGSELVRITVNTAKAAEAVPHIKETLLEKGFNTPIIGDFHYNGHLLLEQYQEMAQALDKYRINPGNVGVGEKHNYNFALMVKAAIKHEKPVRIGVNGGSLDQALLLELMEKNNSEKTDKEIFLEALVQSALNSAKEAEEIGLPADRIVISTKVSDVQDTVKAYEMLSERCNYALHLGVTEAGMGMKGIVASSAALGILLQKGIGDTIRISLTPEPGAARSKEVENCQLLLQTMSFRQFKPMVTSCPGCGRTSKGFFRELAKEVNEHVTKKMPEWKELYPGVEALKIAVMGCIVNGPGESKHADIGISLPGNAEKPIAPVYIEGKLYDNLKGEDISKQFLDILENYINQKFAKEA